MEGLVLFGVNNIYTVSYNGKQFLCRIKGKILQEEMEYYNPISVGDFVEIVPDKFTEGTGWITVRRDRKNALVRQNKKKDAPQIMAANIDTVVCVTSVKSPPFRPRFLDRMIISAKSEEIDVIICVNKCDLGMDEETKSRLSSYVEIGYRIIYTSAETGEGIPELIRAIEGKKSVFAGQSGVGKSTLLNKMDPTIKLKVGEISKKYDRGIHTTRFSIMLQIKDDTFLIDSPGIRELFIFNLDPRELRFYFPEFEKYAGDCDYSSCLHINEPGCRVKEAVSSGNIHPDRYDSYTRIYKSLLIEKEDW